MIIMVIFYHKCQYERGLTFRNASRTDSDHVTSYSTSCDEADGGKGRLCKVQTSDQLGGRPSVDVDFGGGEKVKKNGDNSVALVSVK